MISPAHVHVRCTPMGRTCRWAGEIELTPIGVKLNGSGPVPIHGVPVGDVDHHRLRVRPKVLQQGLEVRVPVGGDAPAEAVVVVVARARDDHEREPPCG